TGNDFAKIFRIQPRTERGRADQVGEHDGELTPFSGRASDPDRSRSCAISRISRAGAAVAAEPLAGRVFAAATGTVPRQRRAAAHARPAATGFSAALRADHRWPLGSPLAESKRILPAGTE